MARKEMPKVPAGHSVTVVLETRQDWIPDPTSTKGRKIRGPATLRISRYRDGGIVVRIEGP